MALEETANVPGEALSSELLLSCASECHKYGLTNSAEWCLNMLGSIQDTDNGKENVTDMSTDMQTTRVLMLLNKREYFSVIRSVNEYSEPNLIFIKYLAKFKLLNLNRFKESPFADVSSPELILLRNEIEQYQDLSIHFNLLLAFIDRYLSKEKAKRELVIYLSKVPYNISAIKLLANCITNPYGGEYDEYCKNLNPITQGLLAAEIALLTRDERVLKILLKQKLKCIENTHYGVLLKLYSFVFQRDFDSVLSLIFSLKDADIYTEISFPLKYGMIKQLGNLSFGEIKEDLLRILADTLYVLKDEDKLGILVSTLERISPGSLEHLYSLATLMSLLGRHSNSLKYFYKSLYLSPYGPEDASILLLIGHEMMFMKRTRGALAAYRLASSISISDPRGPSCAGRSYEMLGLNVHATEFYKESIRRSPWDSRSWMVLGNNTQDKDAIEMSLYITGGDQPKAILSLLTMTKDPKYIKLALAWVYLNDTPTLLSQINSDDIVLVLQLAAEYALAGEDRNLGELVKEVSDIIVKHDPNAYPFVNKLEYGEELEIDVENMVGSGLNNIDEGYSVESYCLDMFSPYLLDDGKNNNDNSCDDCNTQGLFIYPDQLRRDNISNIYMSSQGRLKQFVYNKGELARDALDEEIASLL